MSIFDEWATAGPANDGEPNGCTTVFWILIGVFCVLVIASIFVDCLLRGLNVDFQILDWFADVMYELTTR